MVSTKIGFEFYIKIPFKCGLIFLDHEKFIMVINTQHRFKPKCDQPLIVKLSDASRVSTIDG